MYKYKHSSANVFEHKRPSSEREQSLSVQRESLVHQLRRPIEQLQHRVRGAIQELLPSTKSLKRLGLGALAFGTLAASTGCTEIPNMARADFAVQKTTPLQKQTCASSLQFQKKDGVMYSKPGIVYEQQRGLIDGKFIPIEDLKVQREEVFPTLLPTEEAWTLLQDFRQQSIQKVPEGESPFKTQGWDMVTTVQQQVLSTIYPTLQRRFPSMPDCVETAPSQGYQLMMLRSFSDSHDLFADMDESITMDEDGNVSQEVELIIGKKSGDAQYTIGQQHITKEHGEMPQEVEASFEKAIQQVHTLIEQKPYLARLLGTPESTRLRFITEVQKNTNTSAFFAPSKGVVIYDEPEKSQWKEVLAFHEVVHLEDHAKPDEKEEVIHLPNKSADVQLHGESRRDEFLAMAAELWFIKHHAVPGQRTQWVQFQLQEERASTAYGDFHLALKKFTDRYVQERTQEQFQTLSLDITPPLPIAPACYESDEYWDLLETFIDGLVQKLPTD